MSDRVDMTRHSGESELAYIKRIGSYKDSGSIDKTWSELAEILNKNLREDGIQYGESAYRKKFRLIQQCEQEFSDVDADAKELRELRRELEKEKIKIRDERNEYRRLIREEARKESYMEQITRTIIDAAGQHPLEYKDNAVFYGEYKTDSDMLIALTDIHAGLEIDNFWNKFDEDVLKERMNHYLDRIFEIQLRHGCSNAYVICSELLSGLIHPVLRIENNQDLIDQFLMVTEYTAEFLAELSKRFENVHVYVAPGNHSRISPKKEDSLAHENMDNLVIPFLEAKLQNYKNVYCHGNAVDQGIVLFNAKNLKIVGVHGDKDSPQNVVENIRRMLNVKPDIVLLGHRHTNSLLSCEDTKVIQSGCLSGTDSWAVNIRKHNRPEQVVCVITENEGLDCIYDVKF